MYSFLTDDDYIDKKTNCTKKCAIKGQAKFQDYKEYLENNKAILTYNSKVMTYTALIESLYKIALSENDDKRIETPGGAIHIHTV